jgi:hypothetical protein
MRFCNARLLRYIQAVPPQPGEKENEMTDIKALQDYFEATKGIGVLATADAAGKVDAAIYSRPHFLEEGTLAFIMRDRLTHHNLTSNPHATFLFLEKGPGYDGKRLFLKKLREENNPELVKRIKRRKTTGGSEEPKFIVYFAVEKVLPLIGGEPQTE